MIIAKKSLGQNFLIDQKILSNISKLTYIKDEEILEIGPGTGNLTNFILKEKPKKFYTIEKDNYLSSFLKKKFNEEISIINDDVLNVDETKISKDKLIVFGNLPYNISTEILIKWIYNFKNDFWFKKLVLMFQKEVADRIIAKVNTSNYGRLSIISNWKLEIEKVFDIKPTSFHPKPKIDSTLLIFSPKKNFFKLKNIHDLEIITKVFFNQRRKMIKKPFNQIFKKPTEILNKFNIDTNLRPQNLEPEIYYKLANEYSKLRS